MENKIGKIVIELYSPNSDGDEHHWGQIEVSRSSGILIGMYEDGKVARKLFYMDKAQAKQLAQVLTMLSEGMED